MAVPVVSVVIPAHNEETWLPKCLAAFRDQVDAPNFELIVVDNASTDQTAVIARRFGAIVVSESRPGVSFAREAGFRVSRGRIIATSDADSIVPRDWVASIVRYFDRHPEIVGLGGPVAYDFSEPQLKKIINRAIPVLHEIDRQIHYGKVHFVGANFAVLRSAYLKIGGFSTGLTRGEDLDLAHRLDKVGRVDFVHELIVTTSDRRFRTEGPQALLSYFQNYLEVTRPSEGLRTRFDEIVAEVRRRINTDKLAVVAKPKRRNPKTHSDVQ